MLYLYGALVVQEVHHRAHGVPLHLLGQHQVVQQVEERCCNGPVQDLQHGVRGILRFAHCGRLSTAHNAGFAADAGDLCPPAVEAVKCFLLVIGQLLHHRYLSLRETVHNGILREGF